MTLGRLVFGEAKMADEARVRDSRRRRINCVALGILFGVVVLWIAAPYFVGRFVDLAVAGTAYGALDVLFSGLAFSGVVWTVLLQGEELRLQREEMKRSRAEAERMANAQEDAARLAALVALIAHEEEIAQILANVAFDDPSDGLDVIDHQAHVACMAARKRRDNLRDELTATYQRLSRIRT